MKSVLIKQRIASLMLFSSLFGATSTVAQNLRAELLTPQVPVLIGEKINPVQRLMLLNRDANPYQISQINLSLSGTTNREAIEEIEIYMSKNHQRTNLSKDSLIARVAAPKKDKISFDLSLPVQPDSAIFWVNLKTRKSTDLLDKFRVNVVSVKTSRGAIKINKDSLFKKTLRPGIAVRKYNQDNVNTSRIPGLDTSNKGTLLSIFDARYESSRDLQGHMDIGLHRSEDGGQSWQPMQVVLDMKEWGGLPEKFNGVSDACVLIDRNTGVIYIAGLWMHGVLDGATGKWVEGLDKSSKNWIHQWHSKGSQSGLGVKETSQFLITRSDDDGKTWSDPVNITEQTKRPEWWLYAPAPGHGITLKDGTLVFPTQGRDKNGLPFSNITYSKDGGKTWVTSNPAAENTTECMAVELPDGGIMLNMRDNRNSREKGDKNGRNIAVTYDLGNNWTEHATSHGALIEPTCMASLHRHDYKEGKEAKSLLFFSNPDSKYHRHRMSVKVSKDGGNSWDKDKTILLDEWGSFGYSCLTSLNDEVIGILYEGSKAQMIFQKIEIREFK
ncbi:MAG: exo-alpha-sialidase [Bacteroidales bacterium]